MTESERTQHQILDCTCSVIWIHTHVYTNTSPCVYPHLKKVGVKHTPNILLKKSKENDQERRLSSLPFCGYHWIHHCQNKVQSLCDFWPKQKPQTAPLTLGKTMSSLFQRAETEDKVVQVGGGRNMPSTLNKYSKKRQLVAQLSTWASSPVRWLPPG